MRRQNELPALSSLPLLLRKSMLMGAALGFILILFFLLSAGEPDLHWARFWFVRPLILVPLAGSVGGMFYYLITLRYQFGWRKHLTRIVGCMGYLLVLWLGTVLGLDGTWWD